MSHSKESAVSDSNRHTTGAAQLRGLSLVELLIAMTLGLILISGMIAVFAGNKRSADLNSAMADIQENARFALDNMAREIRMSGFQGCLDLNSVAPTLLGNDLPTTNLQATAAMGSVISDGDLWTPAPPLGFIAADHDAVPGTHALTLQFGSQNTFELVHEVRTGGVPDMIGPIVVDTTEGNSSAPFSMNVGDYAMISNCNGADIFRITSVAKTADSATIGHAASGNSLDGLSTGSLSHLYAGGADADTKFMRFVSSVYYVGDTGQTNDEGDTITALYQQSLPYGNTVLNPPTELVRGVEDMRLAFGIRTGTESLTYVLPTDPQYDPRAVESIRIGLLMNSYDRISQDDDENTYVLAGQAIVPKGSASANAAGEHENDRRYRLAFNTTVKIRNRRATR